VAGSFRPPPRQPAKVSRSAKRSGGSAASLQSAEAEEDFVRALLELAAEDEAAAACPPDVDADDAELAAAARQHFAQRRFFEANARLARQQAVLTQQLQLFYAHLQDLD
jgi:hypothetical protein